MRAEGPKGVAGSRTPGRLALAAAAVALAAGCSKGVLDPAGPVGRDEASITLNALAIMLAVVIPTLLAALGFAVWFRAGNHRARRRPDFAYSGRIELVVWSIPLLVILFLGGLIWVGSHSLDPARPLPERPGAPTEEIQVVALDWKWLFIYPREGLASVNEVVVPAGAPLRFQITSASVMNAFFVPRLGGMIYAMNGMRTTLHLQADAPGAFEGRSAQFSGDGFADMRFTVRSVPPAEFARWAAGARAAGPTLDAAAYAALARQSRGVAPFTYRGVQPGLFEQVLSQALPPGPGPAAGQHGGS